MKHLPKLQNEINDKETLSNFTGVRLPDHIIEFMEVITRQKQWGLQFPNKSAFIKAAVYRLCRDIEEGKIKPIEGW